MRPSSLRSIFCSAVLKLPLKSGSPLFTDRASRTNSLSSIEPLPSRSNVSKQNLRMSSCVYVEYASATQTYSSKEMEASPSISMSRKSWSVSGEAASLRAPKNSLGSILPDPSTSMSSKPLRKCRKCRAERPSAAVILRASGSVMTTGTLLNRRARRRARRPSEVSSDAALARAVRADRRWSVAPRAAMRSAADGAFCICAPAGRDPALGLRPSDRDRGDGSGEYRAEPCRADAALVILPDINPFGSGAGATRPFGGVFKRGGISDSAGPAQGSSCWARRRT
mmetsp:Transcript_25283/g.85005  ORF Transcript_25283/g.85005 Transcript_25283/m.85005 type:complete len:282 (+) Transcript_25283:341-1186(+)